MFYSADSIYSNAWSLWSSATAGTFGMNHASPVWSILGKTTGDDKNFDIYMTNFNEWTWADPSYVRSTDQSIMNLGTFDSSYTDNMSHITIKPTSIGSNLIDVDEFGFGKTDTTAQSAYYENLINDDPVETGLYGHFANKTSLALNFRGLGLPTA